MSRPSLQERVRAGHDVTQAEVVIRRSQPRRGQVQIWILEIDCCPFCKKRHSHGGGVISESPALGFRVAHCTDRPSPLGEYQLVVKEKTQREQ